MFPTGFNPNMYAPGFPTTMPNPGYGAPNPGYIYPASGYGPALPAPAGLPDFGMLVAGQAGAAMAPERFVTSMSGGVIVEKDGTPSGRIPENSYIDLDKGGIYGPDGKQIKIPTGSSVDFFDLPDIAEMKSAYASAAQATGGGADAATDPAMKYPTYPAWTTQVDGQWGPGGTTALNGGAAAAGHAGCDHHGTSVAGAKGNGTTVSAGGGNPFNQIASLQNQLGQALAQLGNLGVGLGMPGMVGGAYGGGGGAGMGPMGALGGYGKLGMRPGDMQQSLNELIFVLRDLVSAMKESASGSGTTSTTQTGTTDSSASDTSATDTSTTTNSGPVTESGSSEDSSDDTTTSTGAGAGASTTTTDDTSTSDESGSDTSASDTSTT